MVWPGPSQAEQLLRVTSGIAAELIKAHDANETVSLNEIRLKISKKYGYGGVPRLVDIISASISDFQGNFLYSSPICPWLSLKGNVLKSVQNLFYPPIFLLIFSRMLF